MAEYGKPLSFTPQTSSPSVPAESEVVYKNNHMNQEIEYNVSVYYHPTTTNLRPFTNITNLSVSSDDSMIKLKKKYDFSFTSVFKIEKFQKSPLHIQYKITCFPWGNGMAFQLTALRLTNSSFH